MLAWVTLDIKKLLSSTVLYGFADVIVLAIGGFFLMPLYTRELSQADYGIYIITRTNTEILSYLVHFGLISAVARLYFEYKKKNDHYQYISSVLLFFVIFASVFSLVMFACGDVLWNVLSPKVPAHPYLWICLAMAVFNFFSFFASILLRVEEKVHLFVIIQIISAVVLVVLVLYSLVIVHSGLTGLLYALVLNSICSATVLPILLWKRFILRIKKEHITSTLRYSVPIVVGYCAYFILNRISTIVLQRYVPVEQVAIFGLGQQLSMIVTMASAAFAKSLQPMIFAADQKDVSRLIDKSSRLYLLLMSCLVNVVILFASDILCVVSPARYSGGYYVLIILLIANFIYSISFIPNTVLLYFRYPTTSVMVSLLGGVMSLVISMILIPRYQLNGAALSILLAFSGVLLASFFVIRNLVRYLNLKYNLCFLSLTVLVAIFAVWLRDYNPSFGVSFSVKLMVSLVLVYITYTVYSRTAKADV